MIPQMNEQAWQMVLSYASSVVGFFLLPVLGILGVWVGGKVAGLVRDFFSK